jgi:serine/threonine-protein kinase HipA
MSLDVYLRGKRIGGLFQSGERDYSFAYTPDAVAQGGAGETLLSHSLPLRSEPFGPDTTRAYIEGLLPQGERRAAIVAELGLELDDGYGLIAALGRDCPGAVVFTEPGEEPVSPLDKDSLAWLSEEELDEVLAPQPERLFDPEHEHRMRFALPGERYKLALVFDPETGYWAWPQPGVPSTHIVKPEVPGKPGIVANEMACTLAYRELGLPVVHTMVAHHGDRLCLISKRFDRWGDGPNAERLHQESFAQALGIAPGSQKRHGETPDLREACGLLRAIGEDEARHALAKAVFCDLGIGDCTARAANAALLFADEGPILAPFFGNVATEVYGTKRRRAPVIGAPPAPLLVDIYRTAIECGLEFQPALIEAIRTMAASCSGLNRALNLAQEEGWHSRVVEEVLQVAIERGTGFKDEIVYLEPPGA